MIRKVTVGVAIIASTTLFANTAPTHAQARSYKVTYNKKVAKDIYVRYRTKKSFVWNYLPKTKKSAKKIHNLWNYKKTSFKVTRLAKVTHLGSFYKIKSNKFSGWISTKEIKKVSIGKPQNVVEKTQYTPISFDPNYNWETENGLEIPDGLKGPIFHSPEELEIALNALITSNGNALEKDKADWLSKENAKVTLKDLIKQYEDAVNENDFETAEPEDGGAGEDCYDENGNYIYSYSDNDLAQMRTEIEITQQKVDGAQAASELLDYDETQQSMIEKAIQGKIWNELF